MRYSLAIVMLLLTCISVFAQQPPEHGWVNLDIVRLQSNQGSLTSTYVKPPVSQVIGNPFFETATTTETATYPGLSGLGGLTVGGGMNVRHGFGVALHVNAVTYSAPASASVTVSPQSTFSVAPFSGSAPSPPLERQERAIDASIVYTLPAFSRLDIRVFGGPTYFHITNNMLEPVAYRASVESGIDSVTVTSVASQAVSASAWGVNIGVDATVPITRYIGVGGVVRFHGGTVTVADPLSAQTTALKVSQTQFGGGLRLRF